MCTVSWVRQHDGYHLFCNRDEKLSRKSATAPSVATRDGVRMLSPADGDYNGTWLAANEYGVTICLLNGDSVCAGQAARSRGLLLGDLACAVCARQCAQRLRGLALTVYAPFTLVVLEPKSPAVVADWNGKNLVVDANGDSRMPLTSSSFDARGVRQSRLREFSRFIGPKDHACTARLLRFHSSHGSSPNAYSTCMHREEAATVSFSWVSVTKTEVRFRYSHAAPCRKAALVHRVLIRAA